MPALVIIADDLTGALDSAVAFAARGMTVTAACTQADLPAALASGAEVVALCTGTRELPADEARAVLAGVRRALERVPGLRMKKVDSRLKGPIAAELDGLLGDDPLPVFACPALPRLGRRVRDGHLEGAAVADPIAIAPRLGRAADIPDVTTAADLDRALPADPGACLLVGAAGLAEALAARLCPGAEPRPAAPLAAPLVLAIGSRDPVTLAQVGALAPLCPVAAPDGNLPAAAPGGAPVEILQATEGGGAVAPAEVAERFAGGVAARLLACPPAALLASGGETGAAILAAIGCGLLQVEGELAAGIPVSRCLDGLPGLRLATKSGGFGGPDALRALLPFGVTTRAASPRG